MKAVILNNAVIGKNCIIGANTLIAEGKTIPDGSLAMGSPGRVVRSVKQEEIDFIQWTADHYVENFRRYRRELRIQPTS